MQPFHLETVTAGGDCAVLRIGGELDAYAAPQVRERVIDLAGNGIVHIIADLSGTCFLDSAGLSALVGSRTELHARGGSLVLVVGSDRILHTLRITGLSDAFAVYPYVLDAITADRHWRAAVSGEGDSTEAWCRKNQLLRRSRLSTFPQPRLSTGCARLTGVFARILHSLMHGLLFWQTEELSGGA